MLSFRDALCHGHTASYSSPPHLPALVPPPAKSSYTAPGKTHRMQCILTCLPSSLWPRGRRSSGASGGHARGMLRVHKPIIRRAEQGASHRLGSSSHSCSKRVLLATYEGVTFGSSVAGMVTASSPAVKRCDRTLGFGAAMLSTLPRAKQPVVNSSCLPYAKLYQSTCLLEAVWTVPHSILMVAISGERRGGQVTGVTQL